jgi:hypothetical protein
MDEPVVTQNYFGSERRRRWPGPWLGDDRRSDPLADFFFIETDQEPDQSPLSLVAQSPPSQSAV